MTQRHRHANAPGKDIPAGDSKAGGETPSRRFAERDFPEGYEQKGNIARPPFEGHPDHGANKGRPNHQSPGADTSGQHGQRPKQDPRSR
jgi:hypothetical protein